MMSHQPSPFQQQMQDPESCPLLFEVVPFRADSEPDRLRQQLHDLTDRLQALPVTALNLPEVREEQRDHERTYEYKKHMKPREFLHAWKKVWPELPEVIINRVVVYKPEPQQRRWLVETYKHWGVRNIILVGGESSSIQYQGMNVSSAASLITREINAQLAPESGFLCGGIAIPTRRNADPTRDEPQRMLSKGQAGLSFFTTQIIYEAESCCQLLQDYAQVCADAGHPPARIFLSFAPARRHRHLDFMRWLGVMIPENVMERFKGLPEDELEAASLAHNLRVFQEIRDFVHEQKLPVSLGLNITPVMRPNLRAAVELAAELKKV